MTFSAEINQKPPPGDRPPVGSLVGAVNESDADQMPTFADQISPSTLALIPSGMAWLAGCASMFTAVRPTATPIWDQLLTALFVAAVTLAGSRSGRWPLLVLAVVPVAFGHIGPAWVFSAAVLGAAAFQDWRALPPLVTRAISATIAAVSAVGLLFLRDFGVTGLSAIIAVATVAVVAWSYWRASSPFWRRELRNLGLGLCVLTALCVVVGSVSLVMARGSANTGIGLTVGAVSDAVDAPQGAAERLDDAASHLQRAQGRVGAFWAKPTRLVPIFAQNHRAVESALDQAVDLSAVARNAIGVVDGKRWVTSPGVVDLNVINSISAELNDTDVRLLTAQGQLRGIDQTWLVGPVKNRLATAQDEVNEIGRTVRTAKTAAQVMPSILGADRLRTYLVIFTNPAEAREFGGFGSAYALITAQSGEVKVKEVGRGGDVDNLVEGTIVPPGFPDASALPPSYLNYGVGGLINYFGNLTGTIDFPTIAYAAREAAPRKGLGNIDGVMLLDPFALAAMMDAGDFEVVVPDTLAEDQNTEVLLNADNLADFVLKGQYEGFNLEGETGAFTSFEGRTEVLAAVGADVFGRLFRLDRSDLFELAEALRPLAGQNRIQFSTYDDSENLFLSSVGLRSELPAINSTTTDHVHVATDASLPNKLSPYLDRSIVYDIDLDPATGRFFGTVSVTIANRTPGGLATYVLGRSNEAYGFDLGDAVERVSVWSNQTLRTAQIDGQPAEEEWVYGEFGLQRRAALLAVRPGEEGTVSISLDGTTTPGSYQIYLGAQPVPNVVLVTVQVTVPDEWAETSTGESVFTSTWSLDQDSFLSLQFDQR